MPLNYLYNWAEFDYTFDQEQLLSNLEAKRLSTNVFFLMFIIYNYLKNNTF